MPDQQITIKEYLDERLRELELRTEQARVALEKATEQARLSMERRLDSMNEFRDALKDQAARSPTRAEFDQRFQQIDAQISTLNTFKDSRLGIPEKLGQLEERIDELQSLADQNKSTLDTVVLISKIIGSALVVSIIGLLFAFLTHTINFP